MNGIANNMLVWQNSFSMHCSNNSVKSNQLLHVGPSFTARFARVPCDDFRLSSIISFFSIKLPSSQFNTGTVVRVLGEAALENVTYFECRRAVNSV